MKEFRMRAFFGILGLAGAGFLVSSVSTVGCGSDNKGSTGTAGSGGSTGAAGSTGNAGTTGGGNSGGNSGGGACGSGGGGGASGPAAGCTEMLLPPAPAPLIADFAVVDGGEPVLPYGGTYKFASPTGAVTPTATVSGGAWHISLQAPGMTGAAQYVGFGIYFNVNTAGDACVDGTQYTGIKFDITGTVGGMGCSLQYMTTDSGHSDSTVSMADKKASGPMGSYPPSAAVTIPAATGSPTVMVPFTSQMNGMPATGIVKDRLIGAQWQITTNASTTAVPTNCDVAIVIDNVSFY